ncbi:MAG: hypothetical protein IPO95_13355 [Rhodanobacteraceae bacterium]|nr:hypothetical protein [Rhodanobacteraceae bacterium]
MFERFERTRKLPTTSNTTSTKQYADIITLTRYVNGEWFPVAGASASYDLRLFREFPPIPKNAIYEDSILLFRALLLGHVARLNEPLVWYRSHTGQVTNVHTGNAREDLGKRKRLASAAVVVALQQLRDQLAVRSLCQSEHKWRLRKFLLKRYWFYRAQDAAYHWPLAVGHRVTSAVVRISWTRKSGAGSS